MPDISDHLQGILDTLPIKPGVYLMKNSAGRVIYVGKAINLRSRVRSYFHKSAAHSRKTRRLLFEVADIIEMVESGELRYILYSDTMNNAHREIAAWVQQSCVPVSVPGVSTQQANRPQNSNQQNVGLRPPSINEVLYDCGN